MKENVWMFHSFDKHLLLMFFKVWEYVPRAKNTAWEQLVESLGWFQGIRGHNCREFGKWQEVAVRGIWTKSLSRPKQKYEGIVVALTKYDTSRGWDSHHPLAVRDENVRQISPQAPPAIVSRCRNQGWGLKQLWGSPPELPGPKKKGSRIPNSGQWIN